MTEKDIAEWGRYRKKVAKAQRSIEILERWLEREDESESFRESLRLEMIRLQRALEDFNLLKRIYSRAKAKAAAASE